MTSSWLSNFCFGISINLIQINYKHPLCDSDEVSINELHVNMLPLMPDEDKNFGGSLVSNFGK